MLAVPLNPLRQRTNSISSCGDESFDPRKLSVTVDEQKRTIRKLNLKVSKLEEALKKERKQLKKSVSSDSLHASTNPQNEMLREQIEKCHILEDTLDNLNDQIDTLFDFLLEGSPTSQNDTPSAASAFKSMPSLDMVSRSAFQLNHSEEPLQTKIERSLKGMTMLSSTVQKQMLLLKKQQQRIKIELNKFCSKKQSFQYDIDELKEFKCQYERERKNCQKLKHLLEKSQYERNQMLTKMDRIPSEGQEKTNQQWLFMSKSLNCRIKDLEKEKHTILSDNQKEKEQWTSKYQGFLDRVKDQKQRLKHSLPKK